METLSQKNTIGILGAGTMGTGIAQVAAAYGHTVYLFDSSIEALQKAKEKLSNILERLVEKGRMDKNNSQGIIGRISYSDNTESFTECRLVIEAVTEDLYTKQKVFRKLEEVVHSDCVLGTNTSSLSIASIASACSAPGRVLGLHFFNPAPLMPLVEVIPGLTTTTETVNTARDLIYKWGKTTVVAKDTPGFIVNRIARPFYGEALRILEEGIADVATIDWAVRELGGFRMGPFELMDFIGNDVNFKVTETVFEAFYYDPRFKPSFTQKRLVEAKHLGRKTGLGFYDYRNGAVNQEPDKDAKLGEEIFLRIFVMLINEAADAVFLDIASVKDIDLAMTKGVNYPKGLLAWADETGLGKLLAKLEALQDEYGEDRYRPNPLLKRMVKSNRTFY